MANIFLEEPIYISENELKESTKDIWLQWVNNTDIDNRKILIRKAEIIIDSVIWSYWIKVNLEQRNIFPVLIELIPINIKKVTILLCEWLYQWWELEAWINWPKKWSMVKSEKYWLHVVEYQEEIIVTNSLSNKSQYINQEIEILLKPFLSSVWMRWSKWV